MSNINYGEIICNAVDEIVSAKLQGLQYDVTKLCTIVNDSSRKDGKYTVSDGSIRFEAYTEDTTLSKGNNVLVVIPNGDYNMQKMITGRVKADSTEPFNYKSPLGNMAKFTSNILEQPGITYPIENTGLRANGEIAIIGPIYSISDADNFAGFTRLGISAEFCSWLNELNVVKGAYGLKLLIYADGSSSPGVAKELVYELTFNSDDMIGNPYQFDSYFLQEKVFDISSLNNIKKIDIYFYQDGQFYDGNNNYIKYENNLDNDIGLEPDNNIINNLFVDNVAVYLGYESSMYEEETLMIYSADTLTYHYLNYPPFTQFGLPKNLSLRWVHKIDDTNFEILNGINLDEQFEVHWFRYKQGAKQINYYAGPDWEEITQDKVEDKFTCSFIPDANNQQELIKAVGYIKQDINGIFNLNDFDMSQNINNIVAYTSNILTFRNEEQVPDNLTYLATTQLSIAYEDNSDGNYFIYNQNGKIINEGDGQGHKRRLQARYRGGNITSNLGTIDYIKWYLPYESVNDVTYTMLVSNAEYYDENKGFYDITSLEKYKGIDYLVITRYPDEQGEINSYQSYAIKNTWHQANNNNIIKCLLSINGVIYEAVEELKFGKAGSQGTNITLVLDFMYGKNAFEMNFTYDLIPKLSKEDFDKDIYYIKTINSNNKLVYIPAISYNENQEYFKKNTSVDDIYIQAIMYDMAGKRIYDKYGTWEWSWYNGENDIITINDTEIIINQEGKEVEVPVNSNIMRLSANCSDIPQENYSVLQVKFIQPNSTTLSACLPIPIKEAGYSHIEGARDVIYNHQGIPTYYTDAYILYKLNDDEQYEEVDETWLLYYDDDTDVQLNSQSKMAAGYIPSLQKLTKEGKIYKALSASPFYASGYNNRVCVSCGQTDENGNLIRVLWSQPILIMQSQYDFAMLNEWDGKLQIDESKGTIMSAMLGAGRKNFDNTFSGVLIGNVQDSTDFVEGGSYVKVKIEEKDFQVGKYYTYKNYSYYPAYVYNEDTDYYIIQNLTGVYGLHEGQISFSLKENGIATFGKAGKGQIIINGNESTIQSSSFNSAGRGLKLDLDDGILHIKDNDKDKIILNPNEPYLNVFGESSQVPIINIGDTEYYLQSDKYALGGLGAKLDLVKGTFDIKGTGGSVKLSGDKDESFFKVQDISQNILIDMNNKEYYLQSASYGGSSQLVMEKNSIPYLMYIDDSNGEIKVIALDAHEKETLYKVYELGQFQLKEQWNTITTEVNGKLQFKEKTIEDDVNDPEKILIKIMTQIFHIDFSKIKIYEKIDNKEQVQERFWFNFFQSNFDLIEEFYLESLDSLDSGVIKKLKYNILLAMLKAEAIEVPYLDNTGAEKTTKVPRLLNTVCQNETKLARYSFAQVKDDEETSFIIPDDNYPVEDKDTIFIVQRKIPDNTGRRYDYYRYINNEWVNVIFYYEDNQPATKGDEIQTPKPEWFPKSGDLSKILFIYRYKNVEKQNVYVYYRYKDNKWTSTSSYDSKNNPVNYTQMQLKCMFAFSELELTASKLEIKDISDGYFNLKSIYDWEFYFLFSIYSNLEITTDNEAAGAKDLLRQICALYGFSFMGDNAENIKNKKSTNEVLTIEVFDDTQVKNYDYQNYYNGYKTETSVEINYDEMPGLSEEDFKKGVFYILFEGKYEKATQYSEYELYYKQKELTVTSIVEVTYPMHNYSSSNYLLPITSKYYESNPPKKYYGLKCLNIKLDNIYDKVYQISDIQITDFPKYYNQETGEYKYQLDGNEPIDQYIELDTETGKLVYINSLQQLAASTNPDGLKIDLNTGHIDGYNLYLSGIGEKGTFVLDSSHESQPFRIGDNFYATWDGALFCQGVKYLGTVPSDGNIINIGNGFKVNSSGGGTFNGWCASAGHAAWADEAGSANWAGTAYGAAGALRAELNGLASQIENTIASQASTISTLQSEVRRLYNELAECRGPLPT